MASQGADRHRNRSGQACRLLQRQVPLTMQSVWSRSWQPSIFTPHPVFDTAGSPCRCRGDVEHLPQPAVHFMYMPSLARAGISSRSSEHSHLFAPFPKHVFTHQSLSLSLAGAEVMWSTYHSLLFAGGSLDLPLVVAGAEIFVCFRIVLPTCALSRSSNLTKNHSPPAGAEMMWIT